MCGAAISVSVESQDWAANWYAGNGVPPIIIKAAMELGDNEEGVSEASLLKAQWMDDDPGTPKVIDPGIEEVQQLDQNSAAGSMLDARGFQNIEVATMFNMDATILNAAVEGSSLTYQNVGTKFEDLLRQCLRPNYLEVIEQSMTDLLTRSTVARFNSDALTLADIKTRYDVYAVGIDKGIIDQEEARSFEGLAPGDVENAAVPFSAPQAIPASLPIQARSGDPVRCDGKRMFKGHLTPCNKLLSDTGEFVGRCRRCGKVHDIRRPVEARTEVTLPPLPVIPKVIHVVEPEVAQEPEPPEPPAPQIVVNVPVTPVTMNVAYPKAEAELVEVRGEVSALGGYMSDLAGHLARLSDDNAALNARVQGVAESQDALVDKLNQKPKARTFVPTRDEDGIIVSVTEAS
jgi:hypothetical protein